MADPGTRMATATPSFETINRGLLLSTIPQKNQRTLCESMCELQWDESQFGSEVLGNYPDITLFRGHGGNLRVVHDNAAVPGTDADTGGIVAVLPVKYQKDARVRLQQLSSVCREWLEYFMDSAGFPRPVKPLDSPARWLAPMSSHETCPIHAYAAHPCEQLFAVARFDGAVEIHGAGLHSHEILIHTAQAGISALAWCPTALHRLAVGCRNGVLLWDIPPNAKTPATVRLFLDQGPASTLAWSPCGELLAAAATNSRKLCVWDVAHATVTALSRPGDVLKVLWSPDGRKLLETTRAGHFRIWNTTTWTDERWDHGQCQSAAWSRCGRVLLLSLSGSSVIYSIRFHGASNTTASAFKTTLHPVFDVRHVRIEGHTDAIGGTIHELTWDETNERLAVSFAQDTNSGNYSPLVAVFRTSLRDGSVLFCRRRSCCCCRKCAAVGSRCLGWAVWAEYCWWAVLAVLFWSGCCWWTVFGGLLLVGYFVWAAI
eukprot:m.9663 g.9663  ORF g.9663 m.9663 type:complete len:487 (+) comp6980_c0_seq2:127-1587(+)